MYPFRRLQAPFGAPALDLPRLNAEPLRQLTVGLAVVTRHESRLTACTRDHEVVRHGTPVIVVSMDKHHTARLFLTAGAGLLTACTPHAWPLITGSVLLAVLVLVITLLVSRDKRTPFERIVVLLCILRRIDPRLYLRPPESARRKAATDPRFTPAGHEHRPRRERQAENSALAGRLAGRRQKVSS
jgi:hypothetical protein